MLEIIQEEPLKNDKRLLIDFNKNIRIKKMLSGDVNNVLKNLKPNILSYQKVRLKSTLEIVDAVVNIQIDQSFKKETPLDHEADLAEVKEFIKEILLDLKVDQEKVKDFIGVILPDREVVPAMDMELTKETPLDHVVVRDKEFKGVILLDRKVGVVEECAVAVLRVVHIKLVVHVKVAAVDRALNGKNY